MQLSQLAIHLSTYHLSNTSIYMYLIFTFFWGGGGVGSGEWENIELLMRRDVNAAMAMDR